MNSGLPFAKFQGAGNDFVVVDAGNLPDGTDACRLARVLCDRHRGVGGDGLLVCTVRQDAEIAMSIFNADGTEDTMCGNGVRCLVRHAVDAGVASVVGVVHTRSGTIPYTAFPDGTVEVELAEPKFAPPAIPTVFDSTENVLVGGVRLDLVNSGSAHGVVFVDSLPEPGALRPASEPIEKSPAFPDRVSVMWTRVEARDRVRIAIWERGVGETLACGTGAVAAVAAAARRGLVDGRVDVVSRGGTVNVSWRGAGDRPKLHGPARRVYDGRFALPR